MDEFCQKDLCQKEFLRTTAEIKAERKSMSWNWPTTGKSKYIICLQALTVGQRAGVRALTPH